jgi:hypothetical protein
VVKRDNVMISGGTGKVNNVIIKWKGRIHGEGRKMGVRGLWLFVSLWWVLTVLMLP